MPLTVLVDADACPGVIRDILFRAAQKRQVPLLLVANQAIAIPNSPWITRYQVSSGFDKADDEIVARVQPDDVVITQDIPLAADVLEKGGHVLTPEVSVTLKTIFASDYRCVILWRPCDPRGSTPADRLP